MIYKSDPGAIRDAQENVDNARYDIKIAEIEKSISNLEKARDKQTDAIDDMISKLEEYKDAWNDVTSAYEEEQENLIAAQLLGADWETDILNGRLDVLNAFKNEYMSMQQEMADAAWKSANEQVKAAKEAEKGSSGSTSKAPKIDSTNDTPQSSNGSINSLSRNFLQNVSKNIKFHAYASGTAGLPKAEKNALVSEYGQTEMTVLPNGDAIITDEPTLMDLPKDTVIYNEEQTKQIMDNKVDASGKAHAGGTNDKPISQIEYIQMLREQSAIKNNLISADEIYPGMDLWQRMEKYAAALGRTMEDMLNPLNSLALDIRKETGMGRFLESINNVSNIINNNRNIQQPVNNTFNITMPNVTNSTSAEALMRDLQSLNTKKYQVDWNK